MLVDNSDVPALARPRWRPAVCRSPCSTRNAVGFEWFPTPAKKLAELELRWRPGWRIPSGRMLTAHSPRCPALDAFPGQRRRCESLGGVCARGPFRAHGVDRTLSDQVRDPINPQLHLLDVGAFRQGYGQVSGGRGVLRGCVERPEAAVAAARFRCREG
jgi:hypothetical protein